MHRKCDYFEAAGSGSVEDFDTGKWALYYVSLMTYDKSITWSFIFIQIVVTPKDTCLDRLSKPNRSVTHDVHISRTQDFFDGGTKNKNSLNTFSINV